MIEEAVRSGLARYEYRHFIVFGAASQFAAMATECAGDQGAWWEFKDAYMLEGLARSFTRAGALDLARAEGLDLDLFSQCLDDEAHADRLLQMRQQAIADGVTGTPTFRVNDRPGARAIDALLEQIRAAAEAAESAGS